MVVSEVFGVTYKLLAYRYTVSLCRQIDGMLIVVKKGLGDRDVSEGL